MLRMMARIIKVIGLMREIIRKRIILIMTIR